MWELRNGCHGIVPGSFTFMPCIVCEVRWFHGERNAGQVSTVVVETYVISEVPFNNQNQIVAVPISFVKYDNLAS